MITSFWNDETGCMIHVIEAGSWNLVITEAGKHGAGIFLEGRSKGSEWLGELTFSDKGVDKFLEFMKRFEKGKK